MIYSVSDNYNVDMWKLDYKLIKQIQDLQKKISPDINIMLHYGVEGKHSESGYHPSGMALDLHFEKHGLIVQTTAMFYVLKNHWLGGIGVYPHWNQQGFHLDIGPNGRLWYQDEKGEYLGISDYLRKYINKEVV